MQWYLSFSVIIFIIFNFPLSVYSLIKSSCSPYLYSTNIDIRANHQYVQPCPVSAPCQCICEIESKRLWIDCFYRQLKLLPNFEKIETNNSIIEWNIDLAFNLFENLTNSKWIPTNMHIRHLVLSGSLAYDLIVQLNLTHRHLIDIWPNQQHLSIINDDDHYQLFDDDDDDDEEEDNGNKIKRSIVQSHHEHTRLLTELTLQLREKTKQIKNFALSLSGDPSSVSILYLDHNLLNSIPTQALYNATNLYELYLSYNNISYLPEYAFGFSHRLTRLDLSYNQISLINNLTFQRHPNAFAGPFLIDYLDLSHNQLTILTTSIFSYLVNLRLLKLEHNQIYSLSAHVWTGLYRLKYLDLSHNYLENFTQVFYSSYLNELNHLKITSNNISQLGSCEFLSLKSLNKLNLSKCFFFINFLLINFIYIFNLGGNNLSNLDTCTFYGLPRLTSHSPLHIHLRSNHFETLHPCTFFNFAHSTIHVENNPLICNCSFNYLLHDRKSLAYTGQECRGGFAYQPQTQLTLPAVRKSNKGIGKKLVNTSITCRNAYRYYNNLCSKLDCTNLCLPNERLIIQITTIATPSKTQSKFQRTFLSYLFVVFYVIFKMKIF
jgi:Leucine-rich repeat (LRR) protein